MSELLNKYVNAYRLLIGGVGELNNIAGANKGDIKDALKRVYELGHIIDELLDVIDATENKYLTYVKIKGEFLGEKDMKKSILTEIDDEVILKNSK